MQGYGPITIAQGSVVSQGVNPSADRVLISNRSSQDVFVSFQPGQPVAATTLGQAWPVIVHAGDQVVYTLRNADRSPTPLGTYWNGMVWLCAVGQPGALALNGNISAAATIYLTALVPGDPTPTLAARPTWTDLSSQPRTVTIPIPASFSNTGLTANFNTGTTVTLATVQFPTSGASQGFLVFYFHGWSLSSADTVQTTPQLQLQQQAAGGGSVGSVATIRQHWLNGPFAFSEFLPQPTATLIAQLGGATQVALLLHNNFASVAGKSLGWNVSYSFDSNSGILVPGIGLAGVVDTGGVIF